MKFSEKYPNIRPIIDEAPNFIIRGFDFQHCTICGELTEYVDLDFEAPVCSEECQAQLEDNYINAMLDSMEE